MIMKTNSPLNYLYHFLKTVKYIQYLKNSNNSSFFLNLNQSSIVNKIDELRVCFESFFLNLFLQQQKKLWIFFIAKGK